MAFCYARLLGESSSVLRGMPLRGQFYAVVWLVGCALWTVPRHSTSASTSAPEESRGDVEHTNLVGAEAPGLRNRPRVALLEDVEAWKCLPPALRGWGRPLPTWARALAANLPRTTATMLELDFLHRARSPLPPALRGRMRWVVAHANGCRYSEVYSEADLRRAGVETSSLARLKGGFGHLPLAEKAALSFARKLTLFAYDITDEEVAELISLHGEKQVVAMALLVAYANFQDRLILALNLPLEADGPLPPLEVRFEPDSPGASPMAPARQEPAVRVAGAVPEQEADGEWKALDFVTLQTALEKQRARRPRIALPAHRPGAPRWGLVCRTYQPELARAWAACSRSFGVEADQDQVFEESLFWVVTRSLQCFY